MRLDGVPYRVVGVLPADFELPVRDIALLVPFSFMPDETTDQARGNEFSSMIARLAPGATRAQLDEQMRAIIARNVARLPQRRVGVETSGFTGVSVPVREQLVGDIRAPLLVLQTGVLLVLLIACANVANLLLMRATGRHREVAIRTAIGAGRIQIMVQMLVEGLLLSGLGAVVGLGLGLAGVRGLLVLRDDSARGTASRGTGAARAGLVVAEVAVALMLLVGAGLLIRSYAGLQEVDPGFSSENVLTAQLALSATSYPDADARRTFWTRLVAETGRIPGVTAVGLTSNLPFNGMVSSGSYNIVGYTPPSGESSPHGRQEMVGGDYFRAMQIPLVAGRVFDQRDAGDRPPVVVIDQLLVDRYFQGKDPIGQQIRRGGPTSPVFTVVGVVGTINSIDLGEPVTKERLYYPVTQQPSRRLALVVKSTLDAPSLSTEVRAAVAALDPQQPMADVRTLDQWVGRSLATRRAPTLLLTLFGAVALLLAGLGIYGVVAYGVHQRVREFGIRQALGADRGTIVRMVLQQGVRTAVAGVALGLVGAAMLTRFLESQLVSVSTRDPGVFATAGVVLLAASILACYIPARGSTRVAPMSALREG